MAMVWKVAVRHVSLVVHVVVVIGEGDVLGVGLVHAVGEEGEALHTVGGVDKVDWEAARGGGGGMVGGGVRGSGQSALLGGFGPGMQDMRTCSYKRDGGAGASTPRRSQGLG